MTGYDRKHQPVLRPPVESAQYTSIRYSERLHEAGIAGSVGAVGDSFDKSLVSYCASCGGWGGNSVGEAFTSVTGQVGVAGCGWLVEPYVFVVGPLGDKQAGSGPVLDRGGVHAEVVGDLGKCQQASRLEPHRVAGEQVSLANVDDYCCGEGLSAA